MLNHSVIGKYQPTNGVRVGIDKIIFSKPLAGHKSGFSHHKTIEDEIINSEFKPLVSQKKLKGFSFVAGKYFSQDGGRKIITVCNGLSHGKPYLHFTLNPNNLRPEDWQRIEQILLTMLNFGLKELLEKVPVRKIELSVDFEGLAMTAFVPISARSKTATKFKNTHYLGKRNSALTFATYDKSKELAAKGRGAIDGVLTRVEARVAPKKLSLLEIAHGGISNPWEHFFCCSPLDVKRVCKKFFDPKLKKESEIQNLGLATALASMSTADRKEFKRLLRYYSIPTFNPALIWDVQQVLLMNFFPRYGASPYQC